MKIKINKKIIFWIKDKNKINFIMIYLYNHKLKKFKN